MKDSIILGLLQNVAMLLTFTMLYDYFWTKTGEPNKWYLKILAGFVIGGIGIVLMLSPWTLYPGLVFDTRSILLIGSGLFFGTIPTIIAIIITSIYRILMGGDGIWMGVAVVVSSGLISIAWRHLRKYFKIKNNAVEFFLIGVLVHIVMLACTMFLPEESALITFKKILWPVILIFPIGTMLLGSLMHRQAKKSLMQKTLDDSEGRWKFALEGSGDGVWDWNAITNEVFFSRQWKAILGYEDHEIENVLHEWDTRLYPEDRDKAYKDLNNHLNGETDIYVNEHRLRCKNGSYKWILDRGKVIDWSAESKPIRVIGTLTDISERKKNEETIKKNVIRNQKILDSAMDGFWIVDKKGSIIEINEIYSKLSGYSKQELLKMKVYDLEANDDKQNVNQRIEKLIQDGGGKFESVHKKKNDDLWHVEVNVKYLDINEGLFVTFIHDITQRKLDEKKIKESEEKYRLLAENQNDLLIKISPEKTLSYANPNYCATFGVKEHEILGKTFLPLIHNDDVEIVTKSLATLVKPPYKTYHEERAKTVDGWRWFGWSVKANLDKSKNITEMIAVGRDITEQKEIEIELAKYRENLEGIVKERTQSVEEQSLKLKESQTALLYLLEDVNESSEKLRITNDQLEMVNKEMEAFSYSVSHDLRAPLTRLDGFSTALVDLYKDKLDDKGKHYLSRIKASSKKMEQLIEDLLSLSRISRQEILKSVVNISAIADKILKDLRKVEPQRKVIVKIEKSIEIFCDSKLITILLQNILSNAWKFTSKNTESIFEIGTKNIDNKMEVFIKDNGVGFNMKYLDKVFLPFQRLHTESEFEGTGIGMATVHRIVKRHDAEITVESKIGEGTIFYLSF